MRTATARRAGGSDAAEAGGRARPAEGALSGWFRREPSSASSAEGRRRRDGGGRRAACGGKVPAGPGDRPREGVRAPRCGSGPERGPAPEGRTGLGPAAALASRDTPRVAESCRVLRS